MNTSIQKSEDYEHLFDFKEGKIADKKWSCISRGI
jgi:hypothetical protein